MTLEKSFDSALPLCFLLFQAVWLLLALFLAPKLQYFGSVSLLSSAHIQTKQAAAFSGKL